VRIAVQVKYEREKAYITVDRIMIIISVVAVTVADIEGGT
jgi:hypothetical protein